MNLNIYQYQDYRKFLRDFYGHKKKNNRGYSYAVFSRKAGLHSPNYLRRVIDGTRNITHRNLKKFIMGLELFKKEAQYFENLVLFNQADSSEVKGLYFQELKKNSQNEDSVFQADAAYYDYLSKWYYVAIHEMVHLHDFSPDPQWMCKRLKNRITKTQAKKALELLEDLGFIIKAEDGRYKQAHPQLKFREEVKHIALQKFHCQVMKIAEEALVHEAFQERELSSLTLCIRKEKLSELKRKIHEFRAGLNAELSCIPHEGDEVVQINFQLISLTRDIPEGGSHENK